MRGVALREAWIHQVNLEALTSDNTVQQQRLARMRQLLPHAEGNRAELRAIGEEMEREEVQLQVTRDCRAAISMWMTYGAVLGAFALAFMLAGLAWRSLQELLAGERSLNEKLECALDEASHAAARTYAILDHGPDAVWAVDREMRLTLFNTSFRRVVRDAFKMEAILGLSMTPPARGDDAPWPTLYARVLGGEAFTVERTLLINGRERHFLLSLSPIRMHATVTGAAVFAKDISARRKAEVLLQKRADSLQHLAIVDELTTLHNRRGFLELGKIMMRDARRKLQPVTILFADMDGLKLINDTKGHHAGDAAIRQAGHVLRATVRRTDIVARLGGDEFAVLITGEDDCDALIKRLRRAFDAAGLSMSMGLLTRSPFDPARSIERLLSDADDVMYADKRSRKKKDSRPERARRAVAA